MDNEIPSSKIILSFKASVFLSGTSDTLESPSILSSQKKSDQILAVSQRKSN